jgi:4-hydroxy-L-threonine phosphate dehydrogenase PdxA
MISSIIAVTIGDIEGIGIEILIKIFRSKKNNRFILFTNYKIFKSYLKNRKINLKINIANKSLNKLEKLNYNDYFNLYDYDSKSAVHNTYNSIIESYKLTKLKYFVGVLTLPINKELIIKNIDRKFIGQTEFYQKIDKKKNCNMLFIHGNLRILTLTTHIKFKKIIYYLSKKDYIYNKILSLNKVFKTDLNLSTPKMIISGINPHASENNTIGNEEKKLIIPILKKLKRKKIHIVGPYSADSLLIKKNNKYDVFIFHYHDQALIPFKLLSNNKGINFTTGLDIIRVSPDHGTAYNIVGKNIANTEGVINCFNFIKRIAKNRDIIANS